MLKKKKSFATTFSNLELNFYHYLEVKNMIMLNLHNLHFLLNRKTINRDILNDVLRAQKTDSQSFN